MAKTKKVPPEKKEYIYEGTLLKWIDGDTCTIRVNLGFNKLSAEITCRLNGINCPEIKTKAGENAAVFCEIHCPPNSEIVMRTHKPSPEDKFGRWLADIGRKIDDGLTINQMLLTQGLAKPWNGKGPKPIF